MPTHCVPCLICDKEVGCCQSEHTLGLGGAHGEGGCENPPHLEFCSIGCFLELRRRIDETFSERVEEIEGKYIIKKEFGG